MDDLPGYSRTIQLASSSNASRGNDHSGSTDSKAHKWLTLYVHSRSPNPTSLPCFYQDDKITGRVDLDTLQSESIKAITIKVTAGTTFVGQEEDEFLNIENELWNPSVPLPNGSKVSKLEKGTYSWPFLITLPCEVEVLDGKLKKGFPLPATFSERASVGYLDYKLTVTIKRKALRVNKTLVTSFAYVPMVRSQPPSPMLQKAIKENRPLPGPEDDPTGWHVLPAVNVRGTLFGSRQVEVTCTLTYARGISAPVWLTLTGTDIQALDLLSSPSAITLFLVRSLATGLDATMELDDSERRTDNFFLETVSKGVFWPVADGSSREGRKEKRALQGEVEVKRSFKPSCLFPKFTTRYHMELRPFEAPGFVPAASGITTMASSRASSKSKLPSNASSMTPLLKHPVTIVNFPAPGIILRSRMPPEYAQEKGADYNNSVGLLENGNQRFYHHGAAGDR
ncbi:hypothetical protein F5141DRAFT_1121046 [Pisolithus sp. B1]|nr:hypothetical protein F5141DRAFT_1121046 [Pisolithus sp. B1]